MNAAPGRSINSLPSPSGLPATQGQPASPHLSGAHGRNRGRGLAQVAAHDDRTAVLAWLARYQDSPATLASYRKEAERLLGVLDGHLADRAFIAGDYSIADMAAYPWINAYERAPLDLSGLPHLRRWQAAIAARPATQRAYALTLQTNPDAGKPLDDAAKQVLFGRGTPRG